MNSKKLVAAACLSVAFTALANGFPQDAYAWSKFGEVRRYNMLRHGAIHPRDYGYTYTDDDTEVPSRSVADWVEWLYNATRRKSGNLASILTEIKGDHGLNARDNDGWTVLMAAAIGERTDFARMLIESGADLDARSKDVLGRRSTALMIVANEGSTEIVRLLIDAKADLNAQDAHGSTALLLAAGQGHTEIARMLIKAGADLDLRDDWGWTALMWAAREGHTEIARMLIKAGADVNVKDQYGKTAHDIAMDKGKVETANVLTDQTKSPKESFAVTGKNCEIRGNVINISAGVNPSVYPLPNGCALTPQVGY